MLACHEQTECGRSATTEPGACRAQVDASVDQGIARMRAAAAEDDGMTTIQLGQPWRSQAPCRGVPRLSSTELD